MMRTDHIKLNGIYGELAEMFDEETARHFYEEYRGQQITFPMEFYDKESIYAMIVAEYNGTNIKQLAAKYDYSERSIRRIIKQGASSALRRL